MSSGDGSDATITRTTFGHNGASGSGGAIASWGTAHRRLLDADLTREPGIATLSLVNSTVSDNSGASSSGATGGGIVSDGVVEMINDTIAGNQMNRPSQPTGADVAFYGEATAQNTIIANGSAFDPEANCFGSIQSNGNNLDSGNSCGFGRGGRQARYGSAARLRSATTAA